MKSYNIKILALLIICTIVGVCFVFGQFGIAEPAVYAIAAVAAGDACSRIHRP